LVSRVICTVSGVLLDKQSPTCNQQLRGELPAYTKGKIMLNSERHNLETCIAACHEAILACQNCAVQDFRAGTALCALISLDCADMCAVTMNSMARGSIHHGDFCAICAHICRACATTCAPHAEVHEHCARCMAACEKCASECAKHSKERHI
jgi:hypothetical protein